MMDLDRVNNYLARVEESEKTTFKPVGSRLKVGVDLGTAYIVLVVLDEENNPVACEKQAAQVLRDGVVVDYTGALRIVRSLKEKLEARLGHGAGQLRHRHARGHRIQCQDPPVCGGGRRPGGDQHPGRAQRRQRHLSD